MSSSRVRQWETFMGRKREEAEQDYERQRQQDREQERIRSQLHDLPFQFPTYTSILDGATRSVAFNGTPQELGTNHHAQSSNLPNTPPTPPASELGSPGKATVLELQHQIDRQDVAIKTLESELRAEQTKVRDLQAERHEALRAQRNAILASNDGEIERQKTKVSRLLELLEQSEHREKELERQIEEGKAREEDMRSQLCRAKGRFQELEIGLDQGPDGQENREMRPNLRPIAALPDYGNGGAHPVQRISPYQVADKRQGYVVQCHNVIDGEVDSMQSTAYAPSSRISGRSRRQDKQMEERGYISVRKAAGGRRLVF